VIEQIKSLNVATAGAGPCSVLAADGGYTFSYLAGQQPRDAVSLGMVVRPQPYASQQLHPIFEMNLPEGRIREVIRLQLGKAGVLDPMLMLAITGSSSPIGRVRVHATGADLPHASNEPLGLSEILRWKGASGLFAQLEKRYALRTGLSGVQPKVLVPERVEPEPATKARKTTLPLPDLIVKAGSPEYPHLAINEFVCLSIARQAGMPVPEFHLSDDHQLLVLRRFDRTASGQALGFEDMAVIMGRSTEQKYIGSYDMVAKAVELFSDDVPNDLAALFDIVALSCIVGNGDAHLKNFGFLYPDPQSPVRLAPAYDIVCTLAYIEDDELALSLGGQKSFYASRLGLLKFGERCKVDPAARIENILAAMEKVLRKHKGLLDECPQVAKALRIGQGQFDPTFRRATSPRRRA
jgi:serine/threonine-protein kinase HipA